jgi:hypothetical protein
LVEEEGLGDILVKFVLIGERLVVMAEEGLGDI